VPLVELSHYAPQTSLESGRMSGVQKNTMHRIKYFVPYTQCWKFQTFNTRDEAQRMITFYHSCGSPASFA